MKDEMRGARGLDMHHAISSTNSTEKEIYASSSSPTIIIASQILMYCVYLCMCISGYDPSPSLLIIARYATVNYDIKTPPFLTGK